MPRLTPDPTFYLTPRDAVKAPAAKLAYGLGVLRKAWTEIDLIRATALMVTALATLLV